MAIYIISQSISVKIWDRQSYLINLIVHFIAFLQLPIAFNLDTIELFYDDCRLLVTFANSLDPDQVTVLCVFVCVHLSVCLSFCACTRICLSSHWRRLALILCGYKGP